MAFDATIVSNVYKDGKGMLCFDRDVTTIGDYAFLYCSGLTSVYCKATTPPTAVLSDDGYWYTFDYNAYGQIIYVPTESVDAYKSATGWSSYADAIFGYEF